MRRPNLARARGRISRTPPILEKSSRRSVPDQTGIREEIPENSWLVTSNGKESFWPPEVGRQQWATIKQSELHSTVVVTRDNPEGGTNQRLQMERTRQLVAATITLGSRLDAGRAQPGYFPV